MDDMTERELSDALSDVRRSYRVAVAYQRRMNEIFHRFHLAMADAGLEFDYWSPNRNHPPMKWDKIQFAPQKWAWDLFPGFSLCAQWQQGEAPAHRVWLGLETDSGWTKVGSTEPDPRDFPPVEEGRTELWLGLYRCHQAAPSWDRVWEEQLAPRWKEAIDTDLPWSHGARSGTYQARRVDVHELVSSDAVQARLIAPTVAWLQGGEMADG